jgi:hypothetical protein
MLWLIDDYQPFYQISEPTQRCVIQGSSTGISSRVRIRKSLM